MLDKLLLNVAAKHTRPTLQSDKARPSTYSVTSQRERLPSQLERGTRVREPPG